MKSIQHIHYAFLALCMLALAGCKTLGIEQPVSFGDRAAYVYSGTDGLVQAATNSLNAHTISSGDAEYVRDAAVRTKVLAESAETAFGSGDIKTAEGRLALAEGVLRQLQTFTGVKP